MPSGGTSTTVQKSDPWGPQQPYLTDIFGEAQNLYRAPGPTYYPGSTVAPMAPERGMALNAQAARALYGSPLAGAGSAELGRTLGGEYLGANPWLQRAIDAASGGLVRNYQSAVAPGIDSSFSLAGRYGSGAHQAAHETAQRSLARQIGDLSGGLSYQNYAAERANQQAALGRVPGFAGLDYADIAQLGQAGRDREALAQALLNDRIARWNFAQQQPADKLRQYAALIQGNYGGTTTTTEPYSAGTGFVGGAAAGAGIGSPFGLPGTLIGAGLGGLLSLF